MVILYTGTNNLKNNQNPLDIGNEIINLAKNIKINGTEVSISSLIPRGDRLSEKGKKVNKELQEKCTAFVLKLLYTLCYRLSTFSGADIFLYLSSCRFFH